MLREKGGTNGPNIWKIRDQMRGKKQETATAVYDEDGQPVEKQEDILRRYKDYFSNLLTINDPEGEEEKSIEEKVNYEFAKFLEKAKDSIPPEITKEEVMKAIKKIKRRKAGDRQGW